VSVPEGDRELVEGHLLRVTLGANDVLLWVRENSRNSEAVAGSDESFRQREPTLAIPWTVPGVPAKGIAHMPAHNTPMKPGSRERLLMAIARARIRGVKIGRRLTRDWSPLRHVRRSGAHQGTHAGLAHYKVGMLPGRPRKPRDKAKVEAGVRFAQTYILGRLRHRTFFSLAECNAAIKECLDRMNRLLATGARIRVCSA
jgi:hypothetical protein